MSPKFTCVTPVVESSYGLVWGKWEKGACDLVCLECL